ncbi:hypothetical protein XELAEV_18043476mg [Xenopus laevis]|uniref:Uncharacterized protein n=1 Tax=Xenopus laevis TaxID=8355 RepID=A0A974BWX0_XENLA|nr:hypothetical protein XELAEV_18043476mg [Xenopus laevis]
MASVQQQLHLMEMLKSSKEKGDWAPNSSPSLGSCHRGHLLAALHGSTVSPEYLKSNAHNKEAMLQNYHSHFY